MSTRQTILDGEDHATDAHRAALLSLAGRIRDAVRPHVPGEPTRAELAAQLVATLETRTAEHALAMARVRELEAIIAGRPAAAMLARHLTTLDSAVLNTVASDLRNASVPALRVAGAAAGHLADGNVQRAAGYLAEYCGLSADEWTAETCTEQGVEVVS